MLLLFLENQFGLLTINRNKIKQMIVSVRSVLCETFTCGNRDAYRNKTQIKGSKYNMSICICPFFHDLIWHLTLLSKQSRNSERLIELIFLTGISLEISNQRPKLNLLGQSLDPRRHRLGGCLKPSFFSVTETSTKIGLGVCLKPFVSVTQAVDRNCTLR